MILTDIEQAIGNTPLLLIPESVHGIPNLRLYAKLEFLNPFGSLKDRIAYNMLKDDLASIASKKQTVLESSSGNTSKALSLLCAKHNISFANYCPKIKDTVVRDLLLLFNTDLHEYSGVLECRPANPADRNDPKYVAHELESAHPDIYFYTKQYENSKNPQAHMQMGTEIIRDLESAGLTLDFFAGFLGTGGSTNGAGGVLLAKYPHLKVMGVISDALSYFPGGRNASELYETGFFTQDFYDSLLECSVRDGLAGMRELQLRCGLPVGPTSGAVYHAIQAYFAKFPLKAQSTAVFIACDRIESYTEYVKKHMPSLFSKNTNAKSVESLSANELEVAVGVDTFENARLCIDIRPPLIFAQGHLPGAINIPYQILIDLISEQNVFSEYGDDIVFYCGDGTKSKRVSAFLNISFSSKSQYLRNGYRQLLRTSF